MNDYINIAVNSLEYLNIHPSLKALSNVSLQIKKGGIVSIIGPSGCGKTTLMKTIAGLLPSLSRYVKFNGKIEIFGKTAEEARKNREFGVVFQDPVLFPWRNVEENIYLPLEITKTYNQVAPKKINDLLNMTKLSEFRHAFPNQLSGGMKHRVALIRALILNPSILLLDEAFGALDELTREHLNLELLEIWSKNKLTIFYITHNLTEAVFVGDRVVVLSSRPATIKEVVEIPIERPRTIAHKSMPIFNETVKQIRNLLEE